MHATDHLRSPILTMGGVEEAAQMHNATEMKQYLEKIGELPTLSPMAMRVVGMLMNIDTTARDLSQLIEKDPAMVSKLLKLVNSSFFGFSSQISSVVHAIMILGFNTVLNAVLSMAVIDAFDIKKFKGKGLDLTALWRHAISVAVVARHLGRSTGGQNDNAFVAGILHDIGKIVMAVFFTERFIEMRHSMDAPGNNFLEAEGRYFPMGHAPLGAVLAGFWKLPDALKRVIARHHDHDSMGAMDHMVILVQAADALVNIHVEKKGPEKWPICEAAWNLMGEKIRTADQWMLGIEQEIEVACRSMLEV